MFDKLKNTIKAEAQKDATKINNALANVKKGVKGAKEEAKDAMEKGAKNLACAPLIPMIPAMLYLLKKEKGIKFSSNTVLTERYKVVESFYKNIVLPYNASHFDMIEMTKSDFDHVDEEIIDQTLTEDSPKDDSSSAKNEEGKSDLGGQIGDLMQKTAQGGLKGAKLGAKLSPILVTLGVPPPADKLAGAGAGAQIGAIVTACVEFFKKGIKKVQDALKKTQKEANDLANGLPISPDKVGISDVNYKQYLLPVVAILVIYFIFVRKS